MYSFPLLCLPNLCLKKISSCVTMSFTMSLKLMSLNICLSVLLSKTLLLTPCVHLLLCLQSLCSSVSYKSLTPVRRPPPCRRGAGGEAVPQERENQINTLVLKDINFTINIIDCLITERLIP